MSALGKFVMGMPVFVSEHVLTQVDRRVRGGYLNRWLIREQGLRPAIIIAGGTVYVHPERLQAFKEACL